MNFIYIIKIREFVNNNQNIYKIGRTTQDNLKRFNNYPKGSILLYYFYCDDCKIIENNIIQLFKKLFIQKKELGNEYFEGDIYLMMIEIAKIIYNNNERNKTIECNNNFKCNKCNKILASKQSLNRHIIICKEISNPLECHICHKIFSHRSSKSKHLKTCNNNLL